MMHLPLTLIQEIYSNKQVIEYKRRICITWLWL